MTKNEFSAAVVKMREVAGGKVEVRDWRRENGTAYRYAAVHVEAGAADMEARGVELMRLAVELCGYFTMYTYAKSENVSLGVAIHRELDAEEADALMQFMAPASIAVALEAA